MENSAKKVSIYSYSIPSKRSFRKTKKVINIYAKKERKKELFTTRGLQTHSPKEHISKASREGSYYKQSRESRGKDITIIKLNKRQKTSLYPLSNKPPYGDGLNGIKGQVRIYSINTQSKYYRDIIICLTNAYSKYYSRKNSRYKY